MKLVIAQGNPGPEYASTRHNAGWIVLDRFVASHGGSFRVVPKFKASIAELALGEEKAVCIKPTTFYNQTGESAQAIASFYKIAPEDTLIIHDELALDFGTIRTRIGGSDAGNKGVKSITSHLGPNTARLRIGISKERPNEMDSTDFVLSRLTKEELETLETLAPTVASILHSFTHGDLEATTHR